MACNDAATRSFVQVPAGECFCLRLEPIDGAATASATLVDAQGRIVRWEPPALDPGPACERLTACNLYIVTVRVQLVTAGRARVRAAIAPCGGGAGATATREYCREVSGQPGDLARIALSIRTVCPPGGDR